MRKILAADRIYTMESENDAVEAVLVVDGRIRDVGTLAELTEKYSDVETIAHPGMIGLPGMIDTHCHLGFTGEMQSIESVFDVADKKEILEIFHDAAMKKRPGETVLFTGYGGSTDPAESLPTLEELDAAAEGRALVCLTAGTHESLASTLAIEKMAEEDVGGATVFGKAERETGVLRNEANLMAFERLSRWMSEEERARAKEAMIAECIENGIVSAHTLEGKQMTHDIGVETMLRERDSYPFHTRVYYQTTDVKEALRVGSDGIGGCFRCLLDGDVDPGTAAFRAPYANDPTNYGRLYFKQDALTQFFREAHAAGLQIGMHAIGDAAIEEALNAYETILKESPRDDHRHRIEHFEIGDYDLIERAADLHLTLAMQPVFDYYWPYETYFPFIGKERAEKRCMLRRVIDQGITVGGGSDAPVTSMNPFFGIHAAVNHSVEASRISVYEAIAMVTSKASMLGFEEDERGTVTVGKSADLVFVDRDPFTEDPGALDQIRILETVYRGRTVWSREE